MISKIRRAPPRNQNVRIHVQFLGYCPVVKKGAKRTITIRHRHNLKHIKTGGPTDKNFENMLTWVE